jgi:hypothetical protein
VFKAYEICEEMFEQRGYDIVEKDDERILAIVKIIQHIIGIPMYTYK